MTQRIIERTPWRPFCYVYDPGSSGHQFVIKMTHIVGDARAVNAAANATIIIERMLRGNMSL